MDSGVFEIRLENVRLYAHHGVFDHEIRDGNEFEVNLSVSYHCEQPERINSDKLENTVSYADLFLIVKEEMETPRQLLETVAAAICSKIRTAYPFTALIECKITKVQPPIAGFIGKASVVYRLI